MGQDLYFDDLIDGTVIETGGYTFTDSDIIDFAWRYDPQPFHVDALAAKESIFGELIASGFHTLAIAWRLFTDTRTMAKCSMGGPAMDDVRWLLPVRVGDTLRATVTASECRPSRSKPDRGSIKWLLDVRNQKGETVLTGAVTSILRRRPA